MPPPDSEEEAEQTGLNIYASELLWALECIVTGIEDSICDSVGAGRGAGRGGACTRATTSCTANRKAFPGLGRSPLDKTNEDETWSSTKLDCDSST